ncbi:unnamed protein product [Arctogadus glacialis]
MLLRFNPNEKHVTSVFLCRGNSKDPHCCSRYQPRAPYLAHRGVLHAGPSRSGWAHMVANVEQPLIRVHCFT